MRPGVLRLWLAMIGLVLATMPAAAEETPKYGGTLTYMIPADAPPTFDAQREQTYATIHSAAPFYSDADPHQPDQPRLDRPTSSAISAPRCRSRPTAARPTPSRSATTSNSTTAIKLTAADVAASLNKIAFPPQGVLSPRASTFEMVDKIEATGPARPSSSASNSRPARSCRRSPIPTTGSTRRRSSTRTRTGTRHNIMGSGPFKFAGYETGQKIKGVRNPDYYHKGLPYLDGFEGIYAPKQAVQLDAIRADRAAGEFRGYPPSAMDQLKGDLGDKIVMQEHDWNCGSLIWFNHAEEAVR